MATAKGTPSLINKRMKCVHKVFETGTEDLVDIQWAPDDSCIVVWDSPVHYSIIAFSPLDGR
jgi:hypothetical protein